MSVPKIIFYYIKSRPKDMISQHEATAKVNKWNENENVNETCL